MGGDPVTQIVTSVFFRWHLLLLSLIPASLIFFLISVSTLMHFLTIPMHIPVCHPWWFWPPYFSSIFPWNSLGPRLMAIGVLWKQNLPTGVMKGCQWCTGEVERNLVEPPKTLSVENTLALESCGAMSSRFGSIKCGLLTDWFNFLKSTQILVSIFLYHWYHTRAHHSVS